MRPAAGKDLGQLQERGSRGGSRWGGRVPSRPRLQGALTCSPQPPPVQALSSQDSPHCACRETASAGLPVHHHEGSGGQPARGWGAWPALRVCKTRRSDPTVPRWPAFHFLASLCNKGLLVKVCFGQVRGFVLSLWSAYVSGFFQQGLFSWQLNWVRPSLNFAIRHI